MRVLASLLAAGISVMLACPANAQSTLEAVKKRDKLLCGVNGQAPGFSAINDAKEWSGLDVDFCRAAAAAVLGDARKVEFKPVNAVNRFFQLAAGDFDVLARNTTVNLGRAVGAKVRYAAINYVDGQAFVVAKNLNIPTVTALRQRTICVVRGTDHENNMALWFRLRGIQFVALPTDTPEAMYEAFFAGRCQAVTQDASALAGMVIASGKAADYMMLPEIISKEPLGPYVREGDTAWLDVVRWTLNAMLEAEEREIGRFNVEEMQQSPDLNVQRFLGTIHGNGKLLRLDEKWAYNIVKQVGNYGESFERNVGQGSPLKFARGVNALWSKGGMMMSPPFN
jgi:general L-amino acid transport system substrate-binding protein